ncbi:hypothetical protein BCR35DRAFT_93273 [Leucosporidium creatinivorum]|uniref:Rho-GAP domain-containing protein n=1 Tax=Leucosporidium creatinivorum TaxID=106004 RepID=A0A1Y2F8Q3_9BASI|nr:hypothetical protein BCR35DRAFT_93273 [Leucosporidium creatinivorum]
MPTSTTRTRPAAPKPKVPEKSSFFTKMKRALSAPGSHDHPHDKTPPPPLPTSKAIFGVPLATVAEYGFVTSMIAGQRHDLPGVCFSTVEEIYRRGQGMNVPGLLHLAGEASRVAKLVAIFDTAPDYGEHHDLSIESIHNVTSLLKKYLRDLPEPILDQRLWRLYLAACVDSTNSLKCRIASAQIILRLLPTPNFSLLVYLVAFLSQMPLFPENRLTLESVSTIFGPAAMSPRMSASAPTSKLPRIFNGAGMHITGPTESFESTGANVKKAQDGLLWLLTNWSSVADGLLEPDFDVDVNEVLGRRPSLVLAPGEDLAATSEPVNFDKERDAVARAHDSSRTLEILSVPRFETVDAAAPVLGAPRRAPSPSPLPPSVIAHEEPSSPSSTVKDSSSPIMPRSFGFNHSPSVRAVSPAPPSPLSPLAPDEEAPPTPSKEEEEPVFKSETPAVKNRESALPSVPVEEEEGKTHSAQASDSTPETASSSRSSDSSVQSAWVATPTLPKEKPNSPLLRGTAPELEKEPEQAETVIPLPRATPEDQFGPVGPPETSVLEDLLEFDDSSIYSFPSPPGTRNFKQTAPFSTAAFDPPPPISPRPEDILLVRSSADQLKEAQALVETQRHEIQSLWKQLTDLELERTADRKEMAELRGQLRTTADRLHLVEQQHGSGTINWDAERSRMEEERERLEEEHGIAFSAMETKFRAAQREAQTAREELKAVHDERYQIQETRAKEDRETKQRIASLETQLNAIRNLLGGGKY